MPFPLVIPAVSLIDPKREAAARQRAHVGGTDPYTRRRGRGGAARPPPIPIFRGNV